MTDTSGASKLIACPGSDEVFPLSMQSEWQKYLTVLESELQCSGVCSPIDFYLFTTTSNGTPVASCGDALTRAVEEHAGTYAGIGIAFALVGLVSCVIAGMIFCVERRRFVPEN